MKMPWSFIRFDLSFNCQWWKYHLSKIIKIFLASMIITCSIKASLLRLGLLFNYNFPLIFFDDHPPLSLNRLWNIRDLFIEGFLILFDAINFDIRLYSLGSSRRLLFNWSKFKISRCQVGISTCLLIKNNVSWKNLRATSSLIWFQCTQGNPWI